MSRNRSPRTKFFVYVVESPSAPDLYHQRGEGDLLRQILCLNGIPCITRCAVSREAVAAALSLGIHEAMQQFPDFVPILHISAHGYSEGVELSSGEHVTWAELKEFLKPINRALSNCLLVCMSSCNGYAGSRMAMWPQEQELPFFAIVGNSDNPTWAETAAAYTCFYHRLANGDFVVEAVEAMRIASGNESFYSTTAEDARAGYMEYLKQVNVAEVRQQLENNAYPPGAAKFAKRGDLVNERGGPQVAREPGLPAVPETISRSGGRMEEPIARSAR